MPQEVACFPAPGNTLTTLVIVEHGLANIDSQASLGIDAIGIGFGLGVPLAKRIIVERHVGGPVRLGRVVSDVGDEHDAAYVQSAEAEIVSVVLGGILDPL